MMTRLSKKSKVLALCAPVHRSIVVCVLCLVAILLPSAPVLAISQDQQNVFSSGIDYFDVDAGACSSGSSGPVGDTTKFLAQWELEESGGGGGEYNPYNYTSGPGTDYNSVGVKNYPDYQTGIQETVVFFNQSNMKDFLSALESGSVQATANALDAFYGSWGGPAMGTKVVADMSNINLAQTIPSMPGHTIGDFAQDLLSALSSSPSTTTDSSGGGCGGIVAGNLVQTAINLAWNDVSQPRGGVDDPSCYSGAQAITPEPSSCHHGFQERSGNGPTTNGDPRQYTSPAYQNAVSQYNSGVDSTDFTDCGVFISTVMHASGIDPNYPGSGTSTQLSYVESHPEKYQIINNVTDISQLQPGDIFINSDHTWMYVGQQSDGYAVAEASQFNHSPEIDAMPYPAGFTLVRVK